MIDANEELHKNKACQSLLDLDDLRVEEVIKLKKELKAKEAVCIKIRSGNDKFKEQNFQQKNIISSLKVKLRKLEEDHDKLKTKNEKLVEEYHQQSQSETSKIRRRP